MSGSPSTEDITINISDIFNEASSKLSVLGNPPGSSSKDPRSDIVDEESSKFSVLDSPITKSHILDDGEKLYCSNEVISLFTENELYYSTAWNAIITIVEKASNKNKREKENEKRMDLVNFWFPKIKFACKEVKNIAEMKEIIFNKCMLLKEVLTTTIIHEWLVEESVLLYLNRDSLAKRDRTGSNNTRSVMLKKKEKYINGHGNELTISSLQTKIQRRWTEIIYGKNDSFKTIMRIIKEKDSAMFNSATIILEKSIKKKLKQGQQTSEGMKIDLSNSAMFSLIVLELSDQFKSDTCTYSKSENSLLVSSRVLSGKNNSSNENGSAVRLVSYDLPEVVEGVIYDLPEVVEADINETICVSKVIQSTALDFELLIDEALKPRLDCPGIYVVDAGHFWEAGLSEVENLLSKITISNKETEKKCIFDNFRSNYCNIKVGCIKRNLSHLNQVTKRYQTGNQLPNATIGFAYNLKHLEAGLTIEKCVHSVLKYSRIELARYFVQSQNHEFFSKYSEHYNNQNCRTLIIRAIGLVCSVTTNEYEILEKELLQKPISSIDGSELLIPRFKIKLGLPNQDLTVRFELRCAHAHVRTTSMLYEKDIVYFSQQVFEVKKANLNPEKHFQVLVVGCENPTNIFMLYTYLSKVFNHFSKQIVIQVIDKRSEIVDSGNKWAVELGVQEKITFLNEDFMNIDNSRYSLFQIAISFISSCFSVMAFKFSLLVHVSNQIRIFATCNLIKKANDAINNKKKMEIKSVYFAPFEYSDRKDKVSYNMHLIEKCLSKSIHSLIQIEQSSISECIYNVLNQYGELIVQKSLESTHLQALKSKYEENKKLNNFIDVNINQNTFKIPINHLKGKHFQEITEYNPAELSYISVHCSISLLYKLLDVTLSSWKEHMGCIIEHAFTFFQNLSGDIKQMAEFAAADLKKEKNIQLFCKTVIESYEIPMDLQNRGHQASSILENVTKKKHSTKIISYPAQEFSEWNNSLYEPVSVTDEISVSQLSTMENITDCYINTSNYSKLFGDDMLNFSQPEDNKSNEVQFLKSQGQLQQWMPCLDVNLNNYMFTFQFEKSYFDKLKHNIVDDLNNATTNELVCNMYTRRDESLADLTYGHGFCGYCIPIQLYSEDKFPKYQQMDELLKNRLVDFWDRDDYKEINYMKVNAMLTALRSSEFPNVYLDKTYWLSACELNMALKDKKTNIFSVSDIFDKTDRVSLKECKKTNLFFRHIGHIGFERNFYSFNQLLNILDANAFHSVACNGNHFYFLPKKSMPNKTEILNKLAHITRSYTDMPILNVELRDESYVMTRNSKRKLEQLLESPIPMIQQITSLETEEEKQHEELSDEEKIQLDYKSAVDVLKSYHAILTEAESDAIFKELDFFVEFKRTKGVKRAIDKLKIDANHRKRVFKLYDIELDCDIDISTELACYSAVINNVGDTKNIKEAIQKCITPYSAVLNTQKHVTFNQPNISSSRASL